jgi:hypothetical protein
VTHCFDVDEKRDESEKKYNPALSALCIVPVHTKKRQQNGKRENVL